MPEGCFGLAGMLSALVHWTVVYLLLILALLIFHVQLNNKELPEAIAKVGLQSKQANGH